MFEAGKSSQSEATGRPPRIDRRQAGERPELRHCTLDFGPPGQLYDYSCFEKQKTIYVSHSLQSIDHSRTMLLNQRLREKRKNAREKNTKSGLSNLRKSQIEAWRTNRSRPEALAQVLAIRIAENAKRRQKKLKKFYHQENKLSFTEKRHNELLSWRKKLTPSPNK